ncbi:MAG TPA: methyltransferase domain-containing protein [Vicinamibacterales bacterium]
MGLSDLFANNVLVKLVRGDNSRYDLIASMVGTRLGDRLLVVGGGDGRLLAAVGAPTGLTGHVLGVEPDPATAERVRAAVTAAGVLAEVETAPVEQLPVEAGSFDVAVVPALSGDVPSTALSDVRRVLRRGGRAIVLGKAGRNEQAVLQAMKNAGFPHARLLASRSGLAFFEALNTVG